MATYTVGQVVLVQRPVYFTYYYRSGWRDTHEDPWLFAVIRELPTTAGLYLVACLEGRCEHWVNSMAMTSVAFGLLVRI